MTLVGCAGAAPRAQVRAPCRSAPRAAPHLACLAALAVVLGAPPAAAQDRPGPVGGVGGRVEVITRDETIRGRLRTLTLDEIGVDTAEGRHVVPLALVERVDRLGDPAWNGLVLGGLAGALAAVLLRHDLDGPARFGAVAGGAAAGVAIDLSRSARRTIYLKGAPPVPGDRRGRTGGAW